MVALGFGVIWWGYLQTLYGYCLMKGYNVTWRELADPIHPYQWPRPGQPIPKVPPGQLMPGKAAPTTTTATT